LDNTDTWLNRLGNTDPWSNLDISFKENNMRIRNVVWDEDTQSNRVVLFGSHGINGSLEAKKSPDYIEVDTDNINTIKEYKRIEVINCLSVFKGEITTDKQFGISLLEKPSKEMLDIEIMDILRNKLSLSVEVFESTKEGRTYSIYFEATTPEGVEIDLTYNYNFIS
jgi:hypothetical protein